jgi:hypothetical protein
MLVQSPALTTSVNASPRSGFHSFHYAPVPSPRQSPSWVSAALSRRQSASSAATSVASPSLPRAKRYVDAATQYSPMEPFNYASSAPARRAQPGDVDRLEPPPPPGPKPMSLPDQRPPEVPAKAVKAIPEGSTERREAQQDRSVQPVSPPKRKSADETGESSSATANGATSPSTLAKRPKPAATPPKVLPQRYEFCAVEDMVVLISHMLGELIETNDALALRTGHLTRFHSR